MLAHKKQLPPVGSYILLNRRFCCPSSFIFVNKSFKKSQRPKPNINFHFFAWNQISILFTSFFVVIDILVNIHILGIIFNRLIHIYYHNFSYTIS